MCFLPSHPEQNEASKNSESESTTSGGLIQNEAKKLLEKSEKELVDSEFGAVKIS